MPQYVITCDQPYTATANGLECLGVTGQADTSDLGLPDLTYDDANSLLTVTVALFALVFVIKIVINLILNRR